MSKKSAQIWSQSVSATLEAVDAGRRLKEGVDARVLDGRDRAIDWVARNVHLPSRRVEKLMRLEIKRVWADEYCRICDWHNNWLASQASELRLRAETLDARAAAALRDDA